MLEEASLSTLALGAAVAGMVHTLAGPDHWAPIIALGHERGWSMRRTAAATALLGLAHCAASIVLVAVVLATVGALSAVEGLQALRADAAGMLLLGGGVALMLAARRRRVAPRAATSVLAVALVLGPCEWLVPAATTAAAAQGWAGAALACGAFSLATVGTMVAVAWAGSAAMARVRWSLPAGVASGGAMAVCGALVLAGL